MSERRPLQRASGAALDRSGLGWRWSRRWARLRAVALAYLPEPGRMMRPRVRIHLPGAVPSVGLRLVIVAIGLLCIALVATGPPGWVVAAGLLVAVFFAPGTMVAGVLVIVLALLMVFDTEPAALWRTPVLIALVPLMLQLAAIAGQASMTARIELRVLELPLQRYVVIQLIAQLLALTGAVVAGLGLVLPQLMAVAVVAVLALVAYWVPTLGPSRKRDF